MSENKKSLRSIEKMSHFRCAECNKWWSVADAPLEKDSWYCTWCGKEQTFRLVEPDTSHFLDDLKT